MPNVILNDRFTDALRELDGAVKPAVLDFIGKLQEDPDRRGLNLKRPEGVVDQHVRTARVTQFWRAVLFELPQDRGFVLVAVKPHDDAYKLAERLRLRVNEVTGIAEIVDVRRIEEVIEPEPSRPAPPENGRVLPEHVKATTLRAFGLDHPVIQRALAVTDEESFTRLIDALPVLQGLALLGLKDGRDPDELYAELFGEGPAEPVDTQDLDKALRRPAPGLGFIAETDDLREALAGGLHAWRIWLHPLQHDLAYRDGYKGPVRVTGGAGTGKTVTALHRARHLADRAREAGETKPTILVATFTKNLAETLRLQIEELAGADITRYVDTLNLDALAAQILAKAGRRTTLVSTTDDAFQAILRNAAGSAGLSPEFLLDEWVDVVLGNGVVAGPDYLRVPRPGRGKALNRAGRIQLWEAVEELQRSLDEARLMSHAQAASAAADLVRSGRSRRTYRHAIVDEAQDLHPAHWRLVRALVPAGTDDLFIVGDGHQRIYGKPLALSRYGIETRGRARRLTINYRTSREILNWSLGVMAGQTVDDLDGDADSLAGARSLFTGPMPSITRSASPPQEDAALVATVRAWLAEGFGPGEVAILSRVRTGVKAARDALTEAGVPVVVVDAFDRVPEPDHVQVMTMHRAKGLEFKCVAITRLGRLHFPPAFVGQLPAEARTRQLAQERALLYVAGTRARERLALLHTRDISDLAAVRNG